MGSVNPVFILSGALSERAKAIGEGLSGSVTLGSGQFCTNPGIVFATRGDGLRDFLSALGGAIASASHQTMLHAGILSGYEHGLERVEGTTGVDLLATGNGTTNGESRTAAKASVFVTDGSTFKANPHLHEEVFGPSTIVVECEDVAEMRELATLLEGNLTGTIHATAADLEGASDLLHEIEERVGRVIINGFPTGVEVCAAMHHGGPYPASSDARTTSVGTGAINRFARPISYQNYPQSLLPDELKDGNPLSILRLIDQTYTRSAI